MSILISIFISGYHGKTTDFAKNSSYHRTTIAHFLNSGKWDDSLLSDTFCTGDPKILLLMSLAHFMCVAGTGEISSFETGYHHICGIIQLEKYHYLYLCAKESPNFDAFMKSIA